MGNVLALLLVLCSFGVAILHRALALENGVALTPPMGWLSWTRFGCNTDCLNSPRDCISERLYLEQAQEIVDGGYHEVGYTYVNIDDCWSEKDRDDHGNLVEDRVRFPNGIGHLSRKIHDMGLKFGMYADIGSKTCAGYPGLEGHFDQDAAKFALDYEIDFLKVDACNSDPRMNNVTWKAFGEALNDTGRPIVYHCDWPLEEPFHGERPNMLPEAAKHCNQWRNYYDIYDSWASVRGVIEFYTRTNYSNDPMVRAAGPGHWNDPDMLVVGNPGLSVSEQQAQFSLWAMFASPLLISADLRAIPGESKRILLNREVIEVNQDALGRQGWCAQGARDNVRVYVRELLPSDKMPRCRGQSDVWAILLANFNAIFAKRAITFDPERHLPNGDQWESFKVRDILLHVDHDGWLSNFTANVDESSVKMFKIMLRRRPHINEDDYYCGNSTFQTSQFFE